MMHLLFFFLFFQIFDSCCQETFFVHPRSVIDANKFTVMAKYIYAHYYERNIKTDWPARLYTQMIHVWFNFKDSAHPEKINKQDYLNTFNSMLHSIKIQGFAGSYIPIGLHSIIDGEHRTASCLVHNNLMMCTRQINYLFTNTTFIKKIG